MSKLKVVEKFLAPQGESYHTGTPSIFIRLYGCNFKCQGFGMPRGELSTEANEIAKNIDQYKSLEDVPLASTGCDSFTAWHPAFKHLAPLVDANELVEDIINLLPYKEWREEHLVITGGEPLLGWQRAYPDLLDHPKMANLKDITFETNGTQHLSEDFKDYLTQWTNANPGRLVTFSVSPKLPASGEPWDAAIKPKVVLQYQNFGLTYLKFVVGNEQDVQDALLAIEEYKQSGFSGLVYLMPVGGTYETFNLTNVEVAELALKYGLRYSDRLHIRLFGNQWGT